LPARIWIDVEDIFIFASTERTPTGIQRLSFELCRALRENGEAGNTHLLRQSPTRKNFIPTSWASLDSLFDRLACSEVREAPALPSLAFLPPVFGAVSRGGVRTALRPVLRRIPEPLRFPLVNFMRLQARAIYALFDIGVAVSRAFLALIRWAIRGGHRARPERALQPEVVGTPVLPEPESDLAPVWDPRPGDVLFVPGAAWYHPDYARMLRKARERGVRVAVLVHDIIPLRRPEWCGPQHVEAFRTWIESILPLCDTIFSNSRATAEEVLGYARLRDLTLRDTVHPIPIGTGFAPSRTVNELPPVKTPVFPSLPAPGSYVLFVSTIEARKNHALLVRVWHLLLNQMPAEKVPTLVFAGRVGWLVEDLMQQLRNTNFLNGKIVLVEHPNDDELAALYRGCRFTLYPSLYEGWGLPVTESLAFGKPCVISNRTSLPEAGGSLARYFDPEDVADALRVIRATIEDEDGLAAWEARVVREFRRVPWEESARDVMRHLQPPKPPSMVSVMSAAVANVAVADAVGD
jgi:glycosyltransferase involved in cell wall biosynthesis